MKRILVILVSILSMNLKAGIIPDANTIILGKILIQGINQIQKLQATYSKMVEFTRISDQTKQEIGALLKLQNDIKSALLTANNIKDLKISDLLYFAKQNVQLHFSSSNFLSSNSILGGLSSKIEAGSQDTRLGAELYNLYHSSASIPEGSTGYPGIPQSINGLSQNIFDQIGMDNYLSDQKGRAYLLFQSFSKRYEDQALELEQVIKSDNLFSMNSSERMNLLLQAGTLLQKSAEMKMEAGTILESKPGEFIQVQERLIELIKYQKGFSRRIQFNKVYSSLSRD
jgi:hypothetical protein